MPNNLPVSQLYKNVMYIERNPNIAILQICDGYRKVFSGLIFTELLEKSQLFWFEDILVSQLISAIVCDCSFIAVRCNFQNSYIAFANLKQQSCQIVNILSIPQITTLLKF